MNPVCVVWYPRNTPVGGNTYVSILVTSILFRGNNCRTNLAIFVVVVVVIVVVVVQEKNTHISETHGHIRLKLGRYITKDVCFKYKCSC